MTTDTSNRAISTAIDTILALVLITASITVMATMLEPESNEITDEDRAYDEADYIIESLNTIHVSVSVSEESTISGETMYTVERQGSMVQLLAEATVANARINGGRVMNTNYVITDDMGTPTSDTTDDTTDVETLRGKILDFLAEAETKAHIQSVWKPADNDAVRGEIEIGPEPPVDEEISTAKLTYPAGFRGADDIRTDLYDETKGEDANPEEWDDKETKVAAHIVEAFLPPSASQYHLEQDAKALEIVEHRYKRMAHLLYRFGNASPGDVAALDKEFNIDESFTEYPDVGVLNNILINMLQDNIEVDATTDAASDPMAVEITVQTW